ncbi:formate dehydrogenase subunit delta [Kribbella amoyensis]|uniref:Formate dehydrogenase subunit delta n=1 Tax=Kribbella amoyensis TaxID=996641 RepID=A0A561BR41_9ACTN|nr:formate dehydrogenase subunit delta [Kribbella amoyensis]TWD81348.1 formate dehydrogenase subunit delta [Kribbella amoyensis]
MGAATMPPTVRLANEISRQFAHKAPEEAATAVANHLKVAWDPRMKTALLAYVDAGGDELDPIAVRAAALLRAV